MAAVLETLYQCTFRAQQLLVNMGTMTLRDIPCVPQVWLMNQFSFNYVFCNPLTFWSQIQSPNSFSLFQTLSNSFPDMSLSAGPASIWVGGGGRARCVFTTSSLLCELFPHLIFSGSLRHTLCHAVCFSQAYGQSWFCQGSALSAADPHTTAVFFLFCLDVTWAEDDFFPAQGYC